MAVKKTGISRDLIIHPGETIAEVLIQREITQAELAARAGVSAAYVCNVIAGKKDISAKFAMGLEYALGVPKSFWLNLQANYDAELLELNEAETITGEEISVYEELKEVISYLQQDTNVSNTREIKDVILPLRKMLQVSNLENLRDVITAGAFRLKTNAEINPYVLGAWIRLCQISGNSNSVTTCFHIEKINELITEIKKIMLENSENIYGELVCVMGNYGIDFSVMRSFKGAPVQGYISQKADGTYQMVLTLCGEFNSSFWFSLFHELGHIVNGDVGKTTKFIDDGSDWNKEELADKFAKEKMTCW